MRRLLCIAAAGTLATTGVGLAAPAFSAMAPDGTLTNFAFDAQAYGSKTKGDPNVSSGATALAHLPCTRWVPRQRSNFVSQVEEGDTRLNDVSSRNFTRKRGGTVSVTSRNTIQGGNLAGGLVRFSNLKAKVRAFHDSNGFHVKTTSDLGRLTVAGTPIELGQQQMNVEVPGYGTLFVNMTSRSKGAHFARGAVNVMRLEETDGTTTRVGKAAARIRDGVEGGIFRGAAWGSDSRTGDTVKTGRAALRPMPCPGTGGRVLTNETGAATLDFGFLGARRSAVYGVQGNGRPHGYTRSHVDKARFGGDVLVFRNINAKANVTRNRDGSYIRTAKGSGIGKILVNGQEIAIPEPGEPTNVAGLGTFTVRKVSKNPIGLEVTGVVVRLFNGSDADTVVNLAKARLNIKRG